jgi:signal transduction histidine kinase/ligand-binding sensor domain-containing protein
MPDRQLRRSLLLGAISWLCLANCWLIEATIPGFDMPSYGFRRFTTEDGLPQNTVRCILQSHDGYLWVATSGGVARYDGVAFTTYINEFLTRDAADARVWDLVEDGQNRVWVRTSEALASYYQGQWEAFSCRTPRLSGLIQTCCASHEGGVWLAMSDGIKCFQNSRITRVLSEKDGLLADQASFMCEDAQGRLWLGFGAVDHGVRWQYWDPRTGKINDLSSIAAASGKTPDKIIVDRVGSVWMCGGSEFIRLFQGQINRYPAPAVLRTNSLNHLASDDTGALWFLCNGSRRVFDFRDGLSSVLDSPELPSKDLRCLLVDHEGLIWIGTGDAGLIQIRPKPFTALLTTNALGDKTEVYSIKAGQEGRLWLGTSEGLVRLQKNVLTRFTNDCRNAFGRFENSVRSVWEDRSGTVWFGVKDEGLKVLRNEQFTPEPATGCGMSNAWTVSALAEDEAGNLWIGSELGLVRRTPAGLFSRVSTELGFADERINGIQLAPDGSIWVGTMEAGLYQIREGKIRRFTRQEGLSSDNASPLLVQADGTVWAGTPGGLNRLRDGRIRSLGRSQGLFDNELYSLIDDLHGFYWATCSRGVFRMAQNDLNAALGGSSSWVPCVTFGEEDGLASSECNGECQPNTALTPDGWLWFSTTRGCARIDPGRPLSKQIAPPVVIEEIVADDDTVFKEGSLTPAGKRFLRGSKPRLPAGHGQMLEIRYTATSFRNPDSLRFQHRLRGHDRGWREAGPRRVALYTNLKPGEYQFEVTACTDQGVYSMEPAVFAFILAPHLWQTWQFAALFIGTVIGLAAGLQAYRLRWQHRLLKLEEQRALANERARIARDLHDDLGTALTGLALELDVAGRDASRGISLNDRLGQTAQRARDLAERMREVVWTINPRCDTVPSLATFLEQQAGQFLNSDGLRVRLDFPAEIPASPVGAEARHQLALSVREAFNNIVRHAHATEVNLSLRINDDCLLIEVVDNGCGFRVTETHGNGLLNMRGRMHQIGGTCECVSAPGGGTTIRLRIPIHLQEPRSSTKSNQ